MQNILKRRSNKEDIFKLALDKKFRYAVLSGLITLLLFYVSDLLVTERTLLYFVLLSIFVAISLNAFVQLSKKLPLGFSYSVILPLHLVIGFLTSFYYFPNLGPAVQVVAFVGIGFALYITFLINNIFLVVEEKGSAIPLYVAAVTWVQILIVVISIPYLAGVFKIPTTFLIQSLFVLLSSVLFSAYVVWCLSFDRDIKHTTHKEKMNVIAISSFVVFLASISTSFIPSETFLRALFVSSVLMMMLTYIYSHYKNTLNSKTMYQNIAFTLVFFVLFLIFRA